MTDSPKKKKPPQPGTPDAEGKSRTALWAAAGVGVGSAAVVAALLYANRSRLTSGARSETKAESDDAATGGPILNTPPETD